MPHAYTEDQRAEQPAIGLFAELCGTAASEEIIVAKRADAGADILLSSRMPEAEIDRHVYALYGLTPAEIKIVEASAAPAK